MGEHEDIVTHLKSVLNQVRSSAAEDLSESKRLSQNLGTEIDKLSKKVAKYEVENTRLKCENKVCRKMVQRYDELVAGLRKQVKCGIQERTRLRKELWSNDNILRSSVESVSAPTKSRKKGKKSMEDGTLHTNQ